ncbi:MAG: hypothetical protein QM644_11665 [Mobilitalea sp.]
MKKKLLIGIVIILLLVLLIPIPLRYKDGGTVKYRAILYSVTDYHAMDAEGGYDTGIQIKILGIQVYDNTTFND